MGLGSGVVQMFKALFMLKGTRSRSKVGSGSDCDVAQLDHGRSICAKFELLPDYGHRDQGQRLNLGLTMTLLN